MSILVLKSICAYLWLFAILSVGCAEDVPRDSETTTVVDPIREMLLARFRIDSFCRVPPKPTNGQWKGPQALCNNNQDCDISEGTVVMPNTRLIYTCDSGYRVEGNPDVDCLGNEGWTKIPSCVPILSGDTEYVLRDFQKMLLKWVDSFCSVPSQPTNGKWKLDPAFCNHNRRGCYISEGTIVKNGSRIIYTCNSGYRVEGNPVVRCMGTDEWTTMPSCIRSVRADTIPSSSMTTTTTATSSYPTQKENMVSSGDGESFYPSALVRTLFSRRH